MTLRTSYTLIASFYDGVVGPALQDVRKKSLTRLPAVGAAPILYNAGGTVGRLYVPDRLSGTREPRVINDQPAPAGGGFRLITLEKIASQEFPGASSSSSSSRRGQVSQTMPPSKPTATAASISNHINVLIAPIPVLKIADAPSRL